jgi:hypothetical protein
MVSTCTATLRTNSETLGPRPEDFSLPTPQATPVKQPISAASAAAAAARHAAGPVEERDEEEEEEEENEVGAVQVESSRPIA